MRRMGSSQDHGYKGHVLDGRTILATKVHTQDPGSSGDKGRSSYIKCLGPKVPRSTAV